MSIHIATVTGRRVGSSARRQTAPTAIAIPATVKVQFISRCRGEQITSPTVGFGSLSQAVTPSALTTCRIGSYGTVEAFMTASSSGM